MSGSGTDGRQSEPEHDLFVDVSREVPAFKVSGDEALVVSTTGCLNRNRTVIF